MRNVLALWLWHNNRSRLSKTYAALHNYSFNQGGSESMTKAITVSAIGGPEVMQWTEVQLEAPGRGEVAIRHTAIGLNFIDVYFRSGLYPAGELPFIPGLEAAGVVEAVGADVDDFQVGDRVAYASRPLGAYSERRNIATSALVPIPDSVSDEQAGAMMLKGMTAQYLLRQTYAVAKGDHIVIHAAAGGVGLIACQWAKHLGATVIGTVSSDEKAALARAHGCDYPVSYGEELVATVKRLTQGEGVPVVYDSVGKETFASSLDCLRPRGLLVSFGQSSGPIEPFDIAVLSAKGSLYLTRPTLFSYTATRQALTDCAADLMTVVGSGVVSVEVNQRFALRDAVQAHHALEGRQTTGSTVLVP